MALSGNIMRKTFEREIHEKNSVAYQRSSQVTANLINRIGLEAELQGHIGCVNCLEWNEKGTLLASGSDDVQIIVWDPFRQKSVCSIRTGHTGNIFSVKFLPNSNDNIVVSGAADSKIRVHDVTAQETTQVFSCHASRVKRIATAPNVPFMFWSAAEDGTIMQFDLRDPESANSSNPRNVLINLNAHLGANAEAKCLSINSQRPEQLAVGANDPYVRLYDRRMLACKSIKFPSDSTSRSPWDRHNLLVTLVAGDEFSLPQSAASYYVAGHLPQKQQDYRKKYRTLASTFLTFSPDGNELLVNLGGEQIYLFDVNKQRIPERYDIPPFSSHTNVIVKDAACSHSNGFNLQHCNGTTNGVAKHLPPPVASSSSSSASDRGERRYKRSRVSGRPLPIAADALKQRANTVFEQQKYNQAILLYNQALAMASDSPILYGNRAAAFMKRNWDGDLYAALRDCHSAIRLDPNHLKAHFRLAKCLLELGWTREALDCLQLFKAKFPDYSTSHACEALDRDIKAAIYSKTENVDEDEKGDADKSGSGRTPHKKDTASDQEKQWRHQACDYEMRFCGHCNTTTDIKEANYFGSNGQYIVAGSDDGSFFIWEKATTNIVRVLRGDGSIVNCLQPHPTSCLLATSGIDNVVRLWSPRAEDGVKDDREVDNSDDAASANQRRMNADPLEVMLLNMGYRIPALDGDEEEEREGGDSSVHCRTS